MSHTTEQPKHPFLGSVFAGVTQVAVGQPLDTIKSCIQASGIRGARKSLRGWRCLYRGSQVNVCNSIATNVIVFNTFHGSLSSFENPWVCGALAGAAATPVEFFLGGCKILRQTVWPSATPLHMLNRPGWLSTCGREGVGFSVYFGTYTHLKEKDLHPFLAGALAGLANWTASYPIDVLRTRQVGLGYSLKDCGRMVQREGLAVLWRGYPACALRAVWVNGASLRRSKWSLGRRTSIEGVLSR